MQEHWWGVVKHKWCDIVLRSTRQEIEECKAIGVIHNSKKKTNATQNNDIFET